MTDHSQMKLGKRRAVHDLRTLKLSNFVRPSALPPVPDEADLAAGVAQWPMMGNDRLGDCTCAAAGHLFQLWNFVAGHPWVPSDPAVIALYSQISGYDPATGANDNGAMLLDLLNALRKTGLDGHKIIAFAAVDITNDAMVKAAIYLFGGLLLGLALPLTAQTQAVWDVVSTKGDGQPYSWGGHAVPLISYRSNAAALADTVCITWGEHKDITPAFLHTYCDEAYVALSTDTLERAKLIAGNGVDFQALESAIGEFGGITG